MRKRGLLLFKIVTAMTALWAAIEARQAWSLSNALPDLDVSVLEARTEVTSDAVADPSSQSATLDKKSQETPAPETGSPATAESQGPTSGAPKTKPLIVPELPPALAVVDQSGILGKAPPPPVIPPQLQGIAGEYAFIATPQGSSGMLREGESLGNIKLVKIGTNRVLIEHDGTPLELTIHWGVGGSTLTPPAAPTNANEMKEKQ